MKWCAWTGMDMTKAERTKLKPRGQHYIPKFYLRGFANLRDQLFTVDAARSKPFTAGTSNVGKERDFNMLEIESMPQEALEQEYSKFESNIASGIKRVRTDATFGEDGADRADVINLITLLAIRNPRNRQELDDLASGLMQRQLDEAFNSKEKWENEVEKMKADGAWPKDKPADYEELKKYIAESRGKPRSTRQFAINSELERYKQMYPLFDALRWRILKAGNDTGGFVTTDHPVCMRTPHDIDRGNLIAPGYSSGNDAVLVPLSSTVALIGRPEGDEDVVEVGRHSVASFNSTVIGYTKRQVYAADDEYRYTRPRPQTLGTGSTLLNDPRFGLRT